MCRYKCFAATYSFLLFYFALLQLETALRMQVSESFMSVVIVVATFVHLFIRSFIRTVFIRVIERRGAFEAKQML